MPLAGRNSMPYVMVARKGAQLYSTDTEQVLTPVVEKAADGQNLTIAPSVEVPEREDDSEPARERESRRAGLLLVVIGVVLMALAATEASAAAEDGVSGPAAYSSETRLESAG